jgi:hypothetical protein
MKPRTSASLRALCGALPPAGLPFLGFDGLDGTDYLIGDERRQAKCRLVRDPKRWLVGTGQSPPSPDHEPGGAASFALTSNPVCG